MSGGTSYFKSQKGWTVFLGAAVVAVAGAGLTGSPAGAAKPPPTRPGVPPLISVKAGPLSAIVAFGKPVHDGGAPVRSDLVTCTSGNGGVKGVQNGPRSPITVHGLSVGKNYRCTVAARNRIGVSNASAPSAVVVPLPLPLPDVPGAPTLTYVHAGPSSLAVGFTPPADQGGSIITTYRAKCRVERRWPQRYAGAPQLTGRARPAHAGQDLHVHAAGEEPRRVQPVVEPFEGRGDAASSEGHLGQGRHP